MMGERLSKRRRSAGSPSEIILFESMMAYILNVSQSLDFPCGGMATTMLRLATARGRSSNSVPSWSSRTPAVDCKKRQKPLPVSFSMDISCFHKFSTVTFLPNMVATFLVLPLASVKSSSPVSRLSNGSSQADLRWMALTKTALVLSVMLPINIQGNWSRSS